MEPENWPGRRVPQLENTRGTKSSWLDPPDSAVLLGSPNLMHAKGHFVIVTWDGGGNVPPALTIGRRLLRAGHQVRVLASPTLQGIVQSTGLDFRGFRHGPDWGSHLGRSFDASY